MQEITQSVVDIMEDRNMYSVAYIDDIAGANKHARDAEKAFVACGQILEKLGLIEAKSKVNKPSQRMIWLGVQFDTTNMTMAIPTAKIQEIHALVVSWKIKTCCTQTQLKSLLGKLFFAANCSGPLRLFSNRLLATLRAHNNEQTIVLDEDFHKDIIWIEKFLITFNGIDMIEKLPTSKTELIVDSCLTGGGGHFGDDWYMTKYPTWFIDS
ncbi:MAG: hypothetical protein GY774_18200, partial [Planctomycetes bacterium]|nr:hypothetical protein [Planctomycetota bacterium]